MDYSSMEDKRKKKPKVTIYIPTHNYGQFLPKAIESVFSQGFIDWELLIILDGPVDNSKAVALQYQAQFPEKVIIKENIKQLGLQKCANIALENARGDYIMRLDADDYLDESALLVLSHYLDNHSEIALVYPNYFYVDENCEILDVQKPEKLINGNSLMDIPAHGACTLVRKRILKNIGGYNEKFKAQDGYDLWLKIARRYQVGNITTPLFFYRQHGASVSNNEDYILETRRRIKRFHAEKENGGGSVKPKVVAIIGARNTYPDLPNIVFQDFENRPLIDYTLSEVNDTDIFNKVIVSTDDLKVKEYCSDFDAVTVRMRPDELSKSNTKVDRVVSDAVRFLEEEIEFFPDIVVYLNIHAPFKKAKHIQKAIDTLMLYNTDSVISVYEDFDLHYRHGENGLSPLAKHRHEQLRIEREALYVDNRALHVVWRDVIKDNDMRGAKIGHIVMTRKESFHIKTPFDTWLISKVMSEKK